MARPLGTTNRKSIDALRLSSAAGAWLVRFASAGTSEYWDVRLHVAMWCWGVQLPGRARAVACGCPGPRGIPEAYQRHTRGIPEAYQRQTQRQTPLSCKNTCKTHMCNNKLLIPRTIPFYLCMRSGQNIYIFSCKRVCLWGLPLGLPLVCLWYASGMPLGCLWDASGMPPACEPSSAATGRMVSQAPHAAATAPRRSNRTAPQPAAPATAPLRSPRPRACSGRPMHLRSPATACSCNHTH